MAGSLGPVEPFAVRIAVRGYELDPRGHVNQAVYLQYAEHARWECLDMAGISHDALHDSGIGPVNLEQTVRYLAELRSGDALDVTCEFRWGTGKTFDIAQEYVRTDGVRIAELTSVSGLMDLAERRLVADPVARMRALASKPEALGL
jgi:acyl-CoA thioester hydrolase